MEAAYKFALTMAVALQATLNNHTFSRYECQIACAIQLYIRNANNQIPNDDTIAHIIQYLRGHTGGSPPPCANLVILIQHHSREDHRALYLSVYVQKPG